MDFLKNVRIFLLIIIFIVFLKKKEFFDSNTYIENQNEIIKNLWVGNYMSAVDQNFLNRNNIKLIINLSKTIEFTTLQDIYKYRIAINDNLSEESNVGMINHFENSYNLIDKFLKNNQGVLIHCRAGAQRSATLAALYLMKKYNIRSEKAMEIVKTQRKIAFYIRPNFLPVFNHFDSKIN